MNIHEQILCGCMFLFGLGKYLGIETLSHIVGVYLTLFNFLINCKNSFPMWLYILHSH